MRTVFQALFQVRLRHSFYTSGESVADFVVEPSPATRRDLSNQGLVFRRQGDGWAVYGEVEPDSSPQTLLRPLGADGLRLTFLLRPANLHLWSISDLPDFKPGRSVFYFNNLRDDQESGRLHLGDSVAAARVGDAVALVTSDSYTYGFAAPVSAGTVTVTDLFGNTVASVAFSLPSTTTEYRLDLAGAGLAPGRYTLADDHGGSHEIYYDPAIFAHGPFGIVEIFSGTHNLTGDGSDLVPTDYRFLDGDELTGAGEYALQLESRSTSWRFNVLKKYTTNGILLADLSITGALTFTKTLESDRAIFTSDAAVALSEGREALELTGAADVKVRDLPSPNAATPLSAGAAPGEYVSEIFVYV